VDVDSESDWARRSNELARELLTARACIVHPGQGPEHVIFQETLGRVLKENLEPLVGELTELDEGTLHRVTERCPYILMAMSLAGSTGVWLAAMGLHDPDQDSLNENLPKILEFVAMFMARQRGPFV
jgi:hypothetical protein